MNLMKYCISLIIICLITTSAISQITIGSNTLPNIGDALEYTTFQDYKDTLAYRENGEDKKWLFDDIVASATEYENFLDISGSELAQEYPNANMIIDFDGAEAAAIKTDRTIEIIGLSDEDFGDLGGIGGGVEFDAKINFPSPFVIRKTPFSYLEKIDDAFDVTVSLGADFIPGLDSLELPIPGSLDSIRVTLEFVKTEEATAWGTVNLLGEAIDVLKVEQIETTNTTIELGLSIFGFLTWLDASEIFGGAGGGGDVGFGGDQATTTYKFMSADSKRSIIEFTENRIIDTLGMSQLNVSGRLSAAYLTDLSEASDKHNEYVLYPNPTQDYIQIKGENQKLDKISIYNSVGQIISSSSSYTANQEIMTSHLEAGVYYLRIEANSEVSIKKFNVFR